MTFSNQEVPVWNPMEATMYDNISIEELLSQQQQEETFFDQEIKIEDTYSPVYQPAPPAPSMLASPALNMPVLCQYNPYSPASQMVQSHASPSNTYAHSPGSSTYTASPVNSPQHSMAAEEYYRYGLRQAFNAAHQQQDYGYYYPQDYAVGKRRKRDDELTAEEYEKRRLRRERNKQAALRCRTRRRERIDALEQETSEIEEDNQRVENDINSLKTQVEELQKLLKEHKCGKQINLNDSDQSRSRDILVKTEPRS